MPWMNSYLPFFEKLPLQLGFQQMKDEKSRDFMNQYMYPNSKENGINGIKEVIVYGTITESDIRMLEIIFEDKVELTDKNVSLSLPSGQIIRFINSPTHHVEAITSCVNDEHINKEVEIENVKIINSKS